MEADLGDGDGVWPRKADPASLVAVAMDLAIAGDPFVDRDGGRVFKSGAIALIALGFSEHTVRPQQYDMQEDVGRGVT